MDISFNTWGASIPTAIEIRRLNWMPLNNICRSDKYHQIFLLLNWILPTKLKECRSRATTSHRCLLQNYGISTINTQQLRPILSWPNSLWIMLKFVIQVGPRTGENILNPLMAAAWLVILLFCCGCRSVPKPNPNFAGCDPFGIGASCPCSIPSHKSCS